MGTGEHSAFEDSRHCTRSTNHHEKSLPMPTQELMSVFKITLKKINSFGALFPVSEQCANLLSVLVLFFF